MVQTSPEERLYSTTKQQLLTNLPHESSNVLNHLNWYTSPIDGERREMSLIQYLIEKSFHSQEAEIELFVADTTTLTGIDSAENLKEIMGRINLIWIGRKIATIRYNDTIITFEILRNWRSRR